MAVYVSPLRKYENEELTPQQRKAHNRAFCRMWTDGRDSELHQVAKAIWLPENVSQSDAGGLHYLLTPGKREQATGFGAVEGVWEEISDAEGR